MTEHKDVCEITANEQLLEFLNNILCPNINCNMSDWKERIIRKSPELGPYIIQSFESDIEINKESVKITYSDALPKAKSLFSVPIDSLFASISYSIASICALGGGKILVDLLKAWVEARRSREITITSGDKSITLKGFASTHDLQKMYDIFKKEAFESKIIKP